MASQVDLIVLGKLKDKNLQAIEEDYLKRLKNPTLNIIELKAQAEDRISEGKAILKKVSEHKNLHLVLLTEDGKENDSQKFSQWMFDKIDNGKKVVFAIGGAEGHGDEIRSQCHDKISLSKLTFPHKLARIIFVEQFYRAVTIKEGHPYHN